MKRLLLPLAPAVLVAVFGSLAACGSSGGSYEEQYKNYTDCLSAQMKTATPSTELPKGPFSASLYERDPAMMKDVIREDTKQRMRTQVEQAKSQQLAYIRCEALRPKPEEGRGGGYADASAAPATGAGMNEPESKGSSNGASEVSGTNNQVAGVDEADFVKNDNKYIYVANGTRFRIIEAWPATTAKTIATVTVPGTAKKLFVQGDRALVYSSVPKTTPDNRYGNGRGAGGGAFGYGYNTECTYGFDGCVPAGDGTETSISIYDISNKAAPKLVRRVHSSSSLIAARRIGNAVHTVLAQPSLAASIGWQIYPDDLKRWYPGSPSDPPTEADIQAAFDALIAKNEATLDDIDLGDVLPTVTDDAGHQAQLSLYQASMPDGSAITSLLSMDIGADPSLKMTSIISKSGFVYSSAEALYMAVPHQQMPGWGWYEGRGEKELSTIHKFSLGATPLATAYRGSGFVKGRVLNQFAMDEKEQRLRVATTTSKTPDPSVHSTITVLEDKNGSLEPSGILDDIAKTEDIRSVRFDGDRGYVVTFKKTDPLFVFDLSDPKAPKTLGELKIPGFSTYMHMMDPTHLLTIGYDAADQGNFAYFTGVLLQIFDVGTPTDPKLVHKEIIGTRGSSSEALTNHLAFNYFAPKNLLALPMTICEGGDTNGGFGSEMTFSGLMVYDTTVANGFSLRGKVAHPESVQNDSPYYNSAACSSWWTNAKSEVRRSIIMDDYVFSVSERRIKVNNLNALSNDITEIPLGE